VSVLDRSVVMLVVLACAAAAQAPLSDSVMKLNRAGRWEQAAQLARNSLGSTASTDERCALRINAIYSLTRLGAYTTAASELKTLDSQCGESAVVRQWAKDLAAIRSELALPPLPKSGLDFSALDQFWNIADLLVKDAEPPEDAWRSMLSSVGYRLSTMVVPTTRSDLEIALRPSRQAEFDSLIKGTDDRASRLKHLAGVVKHRAAIARYRDSISRSLPVQEAIALAARFLPPHATEGKDPPLVAFAVFRDDAYSLGPQGVVIDIEHVTNNGGLTLTLAHEFHHSYLADVAEIGRPPSDDPAFALMNALNGMRNEGIADLIDKPYPLSYPKAPGMARYAESYNAAYAKLKAGNYTEAINAFQAFMKQYPDSTLLDNAQYWTGEAYYVTLDYEHAARAFRTVGDRWPTSRKAPDALLKLGYTQIEQKHLTAARATLGEVIERYPGSDAAKLAQDRLKKLPSEGH